MLAHNIHFRKQAHTVDSKMRIFQYKILNNTLYFNKMKMADARYVLFAARRMKRSNTYIGQSIL